MKNAYLPSKAIIEDVIDESADVKTLTLRIKEKNNGIVRYQPGQFMMLSLAGFGEAPFTFASVFLRKERFQISVKKMGSLTEALHNLKINAVVGVRGPYGNPFPLERIIGKDLLFVAGGIGMAPLRSALQYVFKKRKEYGKIEVVYGCRTPRDILYRNELLSWQQMPHANIHLTVDTPDEYWGGACGVVCVLFPQIKLSPKRAVAFLCGPQAMLKFAIIDILKLGFKPHNIYASLERYMKCGTGKCGHCYIKEKYVCLDGPNFSYAQMEKLGIEA